MLNAPQETVEAVSNAANMLSSTQAGALIVLLLATNIASVIALVRCYIRHSRYRTQHPE